MCNASATRNRPIKYNVDTSTYYELCDCKQDTNAPFCNGTYRQVIDNILLDLEVSWTLGMSTTGLMIQNFHN